ncbi:hypothetical protein [Bacillus sp. OTU530]|jgi:cbb3-type cytochrome oxidase subunit 3|uniref:hypothetical protein n=1 Tax=Bacillus sp. OTU530 TaxID=3043862 RepID=UPI00313A7B41
MKKFILSFLVAIFAIFSIHTSIFAYSYGNPNEEAIAEAYKQMATKLDENPPNYTEAKKIYETVREEIDMHMGPEPSKAIMQNFEKKQKDELTQNMQKLLVLNINRRLSSIEENFTDYDTGKRLLAKGFATYETLSPIIASKDKELDTKLRGEFNKALEALGNPGLFGVGKKEANKDQFVESKKIILSNLQTEFKVESLKSGHFTAAGEETTSAAKKTEWTDLSSLKNWLPIVIIVIVLVGVIVYAVRKRRK